MAKLDVDTVIRLEKSSPGACADDHEALRRQIEEKQVFSNFSIEERQALWSRLCVLTKDRLVPSLRTFFDNVSYLENAGNAMELLVDVGKKGDLRSALAAAFPKDRRNTQNCMVQVSASAFQSAKIHGGCQFDAAYLQLWLYAIRECQDIDKAGTSDKAVEVILHEFALVAAELGFRTDKINSLLKHDPDLAMARRFLTAARPADEYQYDNLEQHAMEIKGLLSTALPMQARIERDDLLAAMKPPARSGKVGSDHRAHDRHFMFLDRFLGSKPGPSSEEPRSVDITSFFIQRSHFYWFFGDRMRIELLPFGSSTIRHAVGNVSGVIHHGPLDHGGPSRNVSAVGRLVAGTTPCPAPWDLEGSRRELAAAQAERQEYGARLRRLEERESSLKEEDDRLKGFENELLARELRVQSKEDEIRRETAELRSARVGLQNGISELLCEKGDLERAIIELQREQAVLADKAASSRNQQQDQSANPNRQTSQAPDGRSDLLVEVARLKTEEAALRQSIEKLVQEQRDLEGRSQELVDKCRQQEQRRQSGLTEQSRLQKEAWELRLEIERLGIEKREREAALVRQGREESEKIAALNSRKHALQEEVRELEASRQNPTEVTPQMLPQAGSVIRTSQSAEVRNTAVNEEEHTHRPKRDRDSAASSYQGRRKRPKRVVVKFLKVVKTWKLDCEVEEEHVEQAATRHLRQGCALLDTEMQVLSMGSCLAGVASDIIRIVLVVPGWELRDLPALNYNII